MDRSHSYAPHALGWFSSPVSLLAIWFIGLGAVWAASIVTGGWLSPRPWEYDTAARQWAAGHGFYIPNHLGIPYYSFSAPLYSAVCAAFYRWASSPHTGIMLFQAICLATLAVVICQLGRRLALGGLASFLAGLAVVFHPGLLYYTSTNLHTLPLDTLLLTGSLYWGVTTSLHSPTIRWVGTGAAIALACYSRGTFIFLLPWILGWLWMSRSGPHAGRRWIKASAILIFTVVLLLTPWWIRNGRIHRQFLFMQSTTGEVLWIGNHPGASGGAVADTGQAEILFRQSPQLSACLRQAKTEMEQDRCFRLDVEAFWRNHPGEAIGLWIKKFKLFWWFGPQSGAWYPPWAGLLYRIYWVGLLTLSMVGGILLWRRSIAATRRVILALAAFLLLLSGAQAIFYVEGRHRFAVEPILILFAAGCVTARLDRAPGRANERDPKR